MNIPEFCKNALPGDILRLEPRMHRGKDEMIVLRGIKGTEERPIKVLGGGAATIDGEGENYPVVVEDCEHVIISGLNACNSSRSVAIINGGQYNQFRNMCGWNAKDHNTNIFGVHGSKHNKVVDCAGWGTARKTFSCSQGGDWTTFSRCWGRWEGSTNVGPKMTYTWAYYSYNNRLVDCLGTWDNRMSGEPYVLHMNGEPYTEGHYDNPALGKPTTPQGIFSMDRVDRPINTSIERCLAYVMPDQKCDVLTAGIFGRRQDATSIIDCVSVIPGRDIRAMLIGTYGDQAKGCTAQNLACVGGKDSVVTPNWAGNGITNPLGPVMKLRDKWAQSPILDRVRILAGEDILDRLDHAVRLVKEEASDRLP